MYAPMARDFASAMHSERLAQAAKDMQLGEAERGPAPRLAGAADRTRMARSLAARATRAMALLPVADPGRHRQRRDAASGTSTGAHPLKTASLVAKRALYARDR